MEKADPISTLPSRLSIFLMRVYRFFLSPWIGNQCRFTPSCSHYSEEAFREYGFLRGCIMTIKRLGRCHPWHPGGYDPVPPATANTDD